MAVMQKVQSTEYIIPSQEVLRAWCWLPPDGGEKGREQRACLLRYAIVSELHSIG